MYNKLYCNIFTIAIFIPNLALANSLDCEGYLKKSTPLPKPRTFSISDNLDAYLSRLKPVYSNTAFNVRIFSKSILRNSFSPAGLKTRVVSDLNDLVSSYTEMGFLLNSFLQVLVEAHHNATADLGFKNGQIRFIDRSSNTPWVGNVRNFVGIPNVFGGWSLFTGILEKNSFVNLPRILVLPAMSSTHHSIEDKFIIAHELAHVTQNDLSHSDLMWLEARADFLAYLTTGQTEVYFPDGIEIDIVSNDGSITKKVVKTVRSISNPTISNIDQIFINLNAYHHNSQIISSTLFEIAQSLGRERSIELIKWMDAIEGDQIISNLKPKSIASIDNSDSKVNEEYIDDNNLNLVIIAIKDHLARIGNLFRQWVNQSTLETKDRETVFSILEQHKI